jgi:hypothetical protein
MEVIKEMEIPASFFYQKIIDSVQHDIASATEKKVHEYQLAGFSYTKRFSKKMAARITIDEVARNKTYQFTTMTKNNQFCARYELKELAGNRCEVKYTESMQSFGTIQQLNDMAVGFVMSFFKKRRFKQMLVMIEQAYT